MKKINYPIIARIAISCNNKNSDMNKDKGNPFLSEYTTEYGIPPFDDIKTEHYLEAMEAGIKQQNEEIEAIVNQSSEPTFENTILALNESVEILGKVSRVFGAVSESDKAAEPETFAEVA